MSGIDPSSKTLTTSTWILSFMGGSSTVYWNSSTYLWYLFYFTAWFFSPFLWKTNVREDSCGFPFKILSFMDNHNKHVTAIRSSFRSFCTSFDTLILFGISFSPKGLYMASRTICTCEFLFCASFAFKFFKRSRVRAFGSSRASSFNKQYSHSSCYDY